MGNAKFSELVELFSSKVKILVEREPKGTDDLTGLAEFLDPSKSSEIA